MRGTGDGAVWESVARRRDYGAKSHGKGRKRTEGQAQMAGELKEDHIFREFENIVHVVGLRLKDVRVWCWRTGLPDALRVGIVPARPIHSGVLEGIEARHGSEGIRKLLVESLGKTRKLDEAFRKRL